MGFVKKSAMLSVVRTKGTSRVEFEGLDHVTNEEVSPLDVLHPIVVLGVVRDVARMRALSANPTDDQARVRRGRLRSDVR